MPGLDIENVYESDSSDNEENHSKLISSVSQLDSTQRIKPAQRKELATHVSEYNLNKGFSDKSNLINVKELAKALGKKPEHGIITKKITNFTKKNKVLPKPLEKPVEERIKRSVGFDNVKKELGKWDAIVSRNALKDQISFPLGDNSMKLQESNEFLSQFKTPTPLEAEIAKVLKQENKEEKIEDEFPLTYEEMLEKRRELAQLRAKLSYKQTKAQRQSKIKSKKYHRLLKREKIRQQLKEFELLQKTDPEAALKKLAELDKTRAKERASLRHRNTGKWAKNLSVRAKYDVETRKVLADQLKMSRELTQKVSQLDVSEDEEVIEPVPSEKTDPNQNSAAQPTTDNPWMINVSKEVQDFVNDYKNFWSENGEKINQNESKKKQCNGITESHGGRTVQNEKILINDKEVEETQKREIPPKSENPKTTKNSLEKVEVKKQKESLKKAEVSSEISPKSIKIKSKETNISAKNENSNSKKTATTPNKTINNLVKAEAGSKKKVNSVEADIRPKKAKINSEKKEMNCKKTETTFKKAVKSNSSFKNKKNSPKEAEGSAKNVKKNSKKTEISSKKPENDSESLKNTPTKEKTSVMVHSASGVWVVTPAPVESKSNSNKKRKADDIDVLFDELNEKLMNKAAKKIKRIENKLKKEEKKIEKVKKKKKKKKEFDLSLKNTNTVERPDLDVGLLEGDDENILSETVPACPVVDIQKNEPDPSIDPKKFIQIAPKRLNTGLPENITGGDDGVDNDKAQQMIIEEAFVDDDVVAEFNKMKEEEEKNEIQIETSLPGWGSWGGTGIAKNKRRKPLIVFKIPSQRKKHMKDTIVNENGNPNLKNHLVKEVPHPFKSVEAFEANIRAPVGRDWVPETAHRKLIEKQVVTKLGTVIEPMSEDEIVKLKKSVKSPFQGKKKIQTHQKNNQ